MASTSKRSVVPLHNERVITNVQRDLLPNGLTLITERMDNVRSVSVGLWLRTGARHETVGENGISHFLEHMVFKGTRNRTAEEIARQADSIGGHLDAFTAKEYTNFSIKVLDEHLPKAMEILADLIRNPLFRPEHISKECQVVCEEIKMVEDTPDDLVHELFTQRYWHGDGLGRPILGTRRTLSTFNRRLLFDFFHRHYIPSNMLVTAAGHVKHRRLANLITETLGDTSPGAAVATGPIPIAHPHMQYRQKKELEQVHICLGAPGYSQVNEKRYACYILNTVLGGGMSSRLFQNVREKRGLAYAVFSGMNSFRDVGCLSIYAGTSAANARRVVQLIVEEFRKMKNNRVTPEELRRAKNYLKGSLLLSLESTMSRMSNLARQEMYFGRQASMDEVARRIDAVTRDAVLEVAREIFLGDRLALTVLGPHARMSITRSDLEC